MKKLIFVYALLLIAVMMTTASCGKTKAPAGISSSAPDTTNGGGGAGNTGGGNNNDPALTLYTLTQTLSLGLTGISRCIEYENVTYCWDDGAHSTLGPGNQLDTFSSFGIGDGSGSCLPATATHFGHDCITVPTSFTGVIANDLAAKITLVLNTGVQSTVNCTILGNGNVQCPNFLIDISQTPL